MKFGLNSLAFADGNIVMLIVLAAILLLFPIYLFVRNKKEQKKQVDLIENLKVGEYVITYSGVFGKIVEIVDKEMGRFLTIETGESHKNYVTVSANAIYMLANNNPKVYDENGNEVKPAEVNQEVLEEKVETTEENNIEKAEQKEIRKKGKK